MKVNPTEAQLTEMGAGILGLIKQQEYFGIAEDKIPAGLYWKKAWVSKKIADKDFSPCTKIELAIVVFIVGYFYA